MAAPKKTTTVKPAKKERSTSTRGHYVKNADLLEAFHEAKAAGKLTDKLAGYLMKIAEGYSRHPWFYGYSFREDLVSAATANLCQNWHKFDPTRGDNPNPFSYYTTACYRSFLSYLDGERKERDVRDKLLVDAGANPSYSFQERFGGRSSDDTAFMGGGKDE